MSAKSKTYRPAELAEEIGVSGKVLRAHLRNAFPRVAEAKNTAWVVTEPQANAVRKHFAKNTGTEADAS